MCHNNTPPSSDLTHSHTNSILKSGDCVSGLTASTATPPRRKNRTKTRKPKYLSLRLQLTPSHHKSGVLDQMTQHQQLNLFPLHPENLVDDKDIMQDDHNVAFLFTSHAPASLNGLLQQDSATTTTTTTEEEEEFMRRGPLDEENGTSLLRKAMKRGSKEEERDGREERWVCYSEVTSYSSANTTESTAATTTTTFGLLSLKLDYEGVLNAWSDQRSLYVPGETPLPVPHHVLPHHPPNDEWAIKSVDGKEKGWEKEEEEEEGEEEERGEKREREMRKIGQREASVLRYKQKRESRLFSKRIRYEVRKLNAEKRPRMKGRFVKRD